MQSVPERDINQGSFEVDLEQLDKTNPLFMKVGFGLASLHQEYLEHLAAGGTPETFVSTNPVIQVHQGMVVMDLVATGATGDLIAELEEELGVGEDDVEAFGRMVSVVMPIESMGEMVHMEHLNFARPVSALTNVGSTTSQGDQAMRADLARNKFDVDGSSVTVGILSDSYDNLNGERAAILSGDLPGTDNPLGNTTGVKVLQELPPTNPSFPFSIDEGRGIAELIHDVAPGSALAFHTAFGGQPIFANGIIDLAKEVKDGGAGADVIVDDVINFFEPMFQDGIIAQAVDTVVEQGVAYFSSAGNDARDAYESTFTPSGQFLFGRELHDFDPGPGVDFFQSITVPVGAQFIASFQWSSPFFSVSGGAGSPNDLDIILFDSTGTIPLTGSIDSNIGGDAVEVFGFFNDESFELGTEFNIAILNFDGPDPEFMKYVLFDSGGDVTIDEFDTASGTLYGHANANGAEAVGAAFYQDTPEFGQDPPLLESFSSAGPTPILFDTDGTSTFEERRKPEIVGPDGTNTTFFPPPPFSNDVEGDGFPNFFGTSASAPHAAAVAALMLEAVPGASPEDIYQALETTALDMDDPSTPGFDKGFDFASGYGFIQAKEAIKSLLGKLPDDDDKDDDYFELDDDDHKALGVSDFLNGGFETDDFTDLDSGLLVENFSLGAGLVGDKILIERSSCFSLMRVSIVGNRLSWCAFAIVGERTPQLTK